MIARAGTSWGSAVVLASPLSSKNRPSGRSTTRVTRWVRMTPLSAFTVTMSPATRFPGSTAAGPITAPEGTAGAIDPPAMTTREAMCDQAARPMRQTTSTAQTAPIARRRAVMIIGRIWCSPNADRSGRVEPTFGLPARLGSARLRITGCLFGVEGEGRGRRGALIQVAGSPRERHAEAERFVGTRIDGAVPGLRSSRDVTELGGVRTEDGGGQDRRAVEDVAWRGRD